MSQGKGGQSNIYAVVIWVLIIVLIFAMILASSTGVPGFGGALDNLPDAITNTFDVVSEIATPIVSGIYFVVAPSGEDDNVKMIAFAIFLLLMLVGTRSLTPFLRSSFLSFLVSAIIGVIAARSLTATILENSALGASPIAAVSLLLGFIPVYALTMNIDKWGITQYSKMVVFTVAGIIYWLIFWFAFDSYYLGLVYGLGIILLGAGQIIAPHFAKERRQRANQSIGQYMAGVSQTIQTAQQMQIGARRTGQGWAP